MGSLLDIRARYDKLRSEALNAATEAYQTGAHAGFSGT